MPVYPGAQTSPFHSLRGGGLSRNLTFSIGATRPNGHLLVNHCSSGLTFTAMRSSSTCDGRNCKANEALDLNLFDRFFGSSSVRTGVGDDQGARRAVLSGFEVDPAGSHPLE